MTITKYYIWDSVEGKVVTNKVGAVRWYLTRRGVNNFVDRKNFEYGAYRYYVEMKDVFVEENN